jgi:hypothetical protein
MLEYHPRWFRAVELLPRATYEQTGDAGLRLFPVFALRGLDGLRTMYGSSLYCNDWWENGGSLHYRGWREPSCPIGAPQSRHKQGIAFDLHGDNMLELVDLILSAGNALGIHRLEEPKVTLPSGYVHIEFRANYSEKVRVFNP